MSNRLAGKAAIITGASKGIGKGIAKVFAREGAKLLLVARTQTELDRTAAEIKSSGAEVSCIAADITQAADMRKMADAALKAFGRIDILCQNAGIFPSTRIDDMQEAEWDQVMTVNLKGTFLAIKACLPAMEKQKYGRIVITSSITGPRTGQPGLAHYAASKGGVNAFMKTAAIELAKYNITVNGIEPGNIYTEGMDGLGPQYIRDQEMSIPLGKLGTPEDCGHAVLFLASDEAKYITGQTIIVDGGQTLPESRFAVS